MGIAIIVYRLCSCGGMDYDYSGRVIVRLWADGWLIGLELQLDGRDGFLFWLGDVTRRVRRLRQVIYPVWFFLYIGLVNEQMKRAP